MHVLRGQRESGSVAAVDFAPKALARIHEREIQDDPSAAGLVFRVRVFSRVGRDAANEVDGCPCLCVEYFFVGFVVTSVREWRAR